MSRTRWSIEANRASCWRGSWRAELEKRYLRGAAVWLEATVAAACDRLLLEALESEGLLRAFPLRYARNGADVGC